MPEQPSFPSEILAVLGKIDRITSPKQGATSQVWIVEGAVGSYVVKYAPQLPFRDWLWREAEVLTALTSIDLPIPRLHFNGHDQSLPYLIMSRLPGEPLSEAFLREPDPAKQLSWMTKFGQVLRRLHDTPAPQVLHRHPTWLDEGLATAAVYIDAGYDLDADDPSGLLAQMQTDRPPSVPQTLIHGDFMWDNVLVHDGDISGIVDWGGGALGDPRYDLALAILPHEDGEISDADVAAFYAAYDRQPLTDAEYDYFVNMYEFSKP